MKKSENYNEAESAYITRVDPQSLAALSKEFNIPLITLKYQCKKSKWREKRKSYWQAVLDAYCEKAKAATVESVYQLELEAQGSVNLMTVDLRSGLLDILKILKEIKSVADVETITKAMRNHSDSVKGLSEAVKNFKYDPKSVTEVFQSLADVNKE